MRNGEERDRSREKGWLEMESERWRGLDTAAEGPGPSPACLLFRPRCRFISASLENVNGIIVHVKVIFFFFFVFFFSFRYSKFVVGVWLC